MNELLEYEDYEYKGNKYRVSGLVKMKHPGTRQWVVAVQYQALEWNMGGPTYVREYQEFIKKFTGIKKKESKGYRD